MPQKTRTAAPQRTRYGNSHDPQGPRGTTVSGKVIAIVMTVLLGFTVFMAVQAWMRTQSRPITAEIVAEERVDDNTARLWVDVRRKNTDEDAYCIVHVVDYGHAEVGRREFVIPAGGEELLRYNVDVPTRAPFVSGRVYGCAYDLPAYLDPQVPHLGAR